MTQKLVESFQGLLDSVIAAAPKVLTAFILLIVALIVAKVVEKVLRAVLVRIKFDSLLGKAGFDTALSRVGLRREMSLLLPRAVYFLLLFLVAKATADALGLVAVSDALEAFFAYMPNLLSAVVLMVLASAVGPFAGEAVEQAATNAGVDFGRSLGRLVSSMIMFVIGLMALAQLKIDTEIIRLVTTCCLAAFALAFGLSFGLGTREITRHIMAGFYARKILRIGEPLEIGERKGILQAITPTHTLIESDQKTISISNGAFLDEVTRQ